MSLAVIKLNVRQLSGNEGGSGSAVGSRAQGVTPCEAGDCSPGLLRTPPAPRQVRASPSHSQRLPF